MKLMGKMMSISFVLIKYHQITKTQQRLQSFK